jgi:hypothetical protein
MATEHACSSLLPDVPTSSRYSLIQRNTGALTSHPLLKPELLQYSSIENIKQIIIIIIIIKLVGDK